MEEEVCTFHRWYIPRPKYHTYCHISVHSIPQGWCSMVYLSVLMQSHYQWSSKCSNLQVWLLLSQRRYWHIWGLYVWCCFHVNLWVLWVVDMQFSIWKAHQSLNLWWCLHASWLTSIGLRHRHTPSRCKVSVFKAGRKRTCRKWHRAWKLRREV